jgi:beta-lactamase regulating signal transducer with metallopeptidase domain
MAMRWTTSKPKKTRWIVLTEAQKRRRRARSIAIALALGVLVVLFFASPWSRGRAC